MKRAPKSRRPASYHHGNLRAAALAEAVALVDEAGPDGLGLRELGRRLGVSHAAVHHHFPSVDGLINELTRTWFGDLDRVMAAAVEGLPPAQALARFRALGVSYVDYAIKHPQRFRLQFRGGANGLVAEADASFRRVLSCVIECVPGAGPALDPLVMTMLSWSAMHGLAMLWIDGAFRDRLDRKGIDTISERVTMLISRLFVQA